MVYILFTELCFVWAILTLILDRSVLISPEDAPRYAGLPLEWEGFCG